MAVVQQQPAGGTVNGAHLSSAIVIAEEAGLKARIAAVLEAHGLGPTEQIDAPSVITEFELDGSTIVVFVCDIDAPQEMTSLRRLCREAPEPGIVVISLPATGAGVRRTLDAGADALVFEPELELTLAATIQAVASGQSVVPRKLRASVERPSLSHREHQVLTLVHQGMTNAEIAEHLFLAESTIKSHLASVFTKFGVHSRKEAAAVFVDLDLEAARVSPALALPGQPERTTA
jgi:DNA-binding NarL/FixJ family response regulator